MMKLKFIPNRLKAIRRLFGLTYSDLNDLMKKEANRKRKFNLDRAELGRNEPSFEMIELVAKVLDIPIGFFYYKNVKITLIDLSLMIEIAETKEVRKYQIDFLK